jgi:hypothetical protein
MMSIHKKIVVDEEGNPQEVIIPWKEFQEIVEMLGLDLDAPALEDLQKAREDRQNGRHGNFINLDRL